MTQCSILLVDDHQLFRAGLRLLLSSREGYSIVAEAANGREMIEYLEGNKEQLPDIILLDIAMPLMDGIEAAKIALEKFPTLKIITLSLYGEEDYYFTLVSYGVKGFLLKNSSINEVSAAIDGVLSNGTYFSKELLTSLVNNSNQDDFVPDMGCVLSDREREIMTLICRGMTTNEIADLLYISRRTVDTHRANILEKTSAKNTANLVVYAIKHNLIEI